MQKQSAWEAACDQVQGNDLSKEIKKIGVRLTCKRCGGEFINTVHNKKYCGSYKEKTGCSYLIHQRQREEVFRRQFKRIDGTRLRFEVFKRDGFTCVYCGRKPPEVSLELDHVLPFSKGGVNEYDNLVCCCRDCNSGKSNILLSENTVTTRHINQGTVTGF